MVLCSSVLLKEDQMAGGNGEIISIAFPDLEALVFRALLGGIDDVDVDSLRPLAA